MKRSKAEKRLAVLVHNAAFEQAKEDQANAMLSTDAGPRGQTTVEEAEQLGELLFGKKVSKEMT